MLIAGITEQAFTFISINQFIMSQKQQQLWTPSLFVKSFIGYIYFMQGVYLGLISSTAFLYPVLSAFSLSALPFSFKYISAPFVERFTFIAYGRRKFWIVLSLFVTSILTIPLSTVIADPESYRITVAILFAIMLMISIGDVCTDAASVKQLKNPSLAGLLQAVMQPIGSVVGGILIIKIINPTFWAFMGIQGILCTPKTFLQAIGAIGFVLAVLIHFCYTERVTEAQVGQTADIKTIIKYYRHFINPKYMLCRQIIYMIVIYQGLKFFIIGYGPEVIYRGFPKQTLAQYDTLCIGIAMIVNSILSRFITEKNIWKVVKAFYLFQLVLYSILYLCDSADQRVIVFTVICLNLFQYIAFLLRSIKNNSFGETQFAGLCLTTLGSFSNLGNNSWLQLQCISLFGYQRAVGGGLIIACLIGIFLTPLINWIHRGAPEIHKVQHHQHEN